MFGGAAWSTTLILLFAKKFFHAALQKISGHRPPLQGDTNEVNRTNILAPGFRPRVCGTHLLPAFTPESFRGLAQWEVVSSYSSATAPDSHGISCADPLFSSSQRTDSTSSGVRLPVQALFNQSRNKPFCNRVILLQICSSLVERNSPAPISHSRCRKISGRTASHGDR